MVHYVWKFPRFRYHSNSGWSDINFICTVKLDDPPKDPYGDLVQVLWWYFINTLIYDQFCVPLTTTGCHGNKCGSNRNLIALFWLPDPENPSFVQSCKHLARVFNGAQIMVMWANCGMKPSSQGMKSGHKTRMLSCIMEWTSPFCQRVNYER